jgi:hypothetical protein
MIVLGVGVKDRAHPVPIAPINAASVPSHIILNVQSVSDTCQPLSVAHCSVSPRFALSVSG